MDNQHGKQDESEAKKGGRVTYEEIREVMDIAEKAEKNGCDVVAVFREMRRLSDEGIELEPDEALQHFQRIGWGKMG